MRFAATVVLWFVSFSIHAAPGAAACDAIAGLRGLAVADQAAAGHGADGRATARAQQVEPTITAALWRPAAGAVPEYCRVEGFITTGSAHEGFGRVRFAVNLPSAWNGRFVMIGDGGHDGAVSTSTARLAQGYATANSDMGHNGQVFPGATFAFNNRVAEVDYGW